MWPQTDTKDTVKVKFPATHQAQSPQLLAGKGTVLYVAKNNCQYKHSLKGSCCVSLMWINFHLCPVWRGLIVENWVSWVGSDGKSFVGEKSWNIKQRKGSEKGQYSTSCYCSVNPPTPKNNNNISWRGLAGGFRVCVHKSVSCQRKQLSQWVRRRWYHHPHESFLGCV